MLIKSIKGIIKSIIIGFLDIKLRNEIYRKRKRHGKLIILISTAYWGNVGDHAIVLSEKEIIRAAGMGEKIVDIDSVQYSRLKHKIKFLIRDEDTIIIDGGGNFGDTWPETQIGINNIIDTFTHNRIIVFPESWYFTNSQNGQKLLSDTVKSISNHPNIVIYARDSYSYMMMKTYLANSDIRQSLDMVFFLEFKSEAVKENGIALVVRDDKESVNTKFTKNALKKELQDNGFFCYEICNDCYRHISKRKRSKYVQDIVRQYKKAEFVITDRFHGMVLSILCGKPCAIIDNVTGKVGNSYRDIKEYVNGVLYLDNNYNSIEDLLSFIEKNNKLTVSETFLTRIKENKKDLINEIGR